MRENILKMPRVVIAALGILVLAAFLVIMNGAAILLAELPIFQTGYSLQMAAELVAGIYTFAVLVLFGYRHVLKDRGIGYLKGFYVGGFMTGYCIFMVIAQMYVQRVMTENELQPAGLLLTFVITMFLVGWNEEVLVRGIILNLFLDRFGNSKKGIFTSIILSSLIFGCAHLPNVISGVPLTSVVIQTIQATLIGVMFAAIYLRTGNLWITIIIHAVTDFAGLFGSGMFGNGTMVDGIGTLTILNLVVTVPLFLVPCIVLLRKAGIEQIINLRNGVTVEVTKEQAEGMATVSLVLGVLGITFGCAGYGAGFSVVGLLGAVWSKKAKPQENSIAAAGMITSIVGLCIAAAVVIVMMIVLPMAGGMSNLQSIYQM